MPSGEPDAMIGIRMESAIAASPEALFGFLTTTENFRRWQEGLVRVEQLDPGPWAAGTRLRTVHSFLVWNNLVDYSEITAIEPGRRIANKGKAGPNAYREEFLLIPQERGVLLRYRADIEPGGVFRYLKTLCAWNFRGQMRRSLARLKAILEAG